MASSSASAATRYQVFLSFRGPDTRQGFADMLYHSLRDAGIRVFQDTEEIRKGEEIGEVILSAIEESRIMLPIFSRGYASSSWCLHELTKMMESVKRSSGKKIIPIFYDVGVDEVRLEAGPYRDALNLHSERYDRHQVQQWEGALREVADIHGFHFKDSGQGEFPRLLVENISLKLKVEQIPVTEYFVQMDDQVEGLMKLLDIESSDVRFVGIFGMGGIGKTTLAKVVYNGLCDHFDSCSFLAGVRESSRQYKGIERLQKQLLCDLGVGAGEIIDVDDGMRKMRNELVQKKVLIVLDDVDHREQIQCLARDASWFGSGSRIIITTRNQYVLEQRRIQALEVEEMEPQDARRLFCMHAFGQDSPLVEYLSLSEDVLASTGQLPLALEVLGSHLHGRPHKVWVDTIESLKKVPHQDVQEKLMISYEALNSEAQHIFLDIACFFIDHENIYPMYMWQACDFEPEMGLKKLISMSLVKVIVEEDEYPKGFQRKKFWMHDQLRRLGKQIIYDRSFKDGLPPSRLWMHGDALKVLQEEEDKANVEMLRLSYDKSEEGYTFTQRELSTLRKVRYLECPGGNFSGELKHFLPELRWLSWHNCPPEFAGTGFYLSNLVILDLSHSDITENWGGWTLIEVGRTLKVLDLAYCKNLRRTPDLTNYVSLERFILAGCSNLVEIDQSIGKLKGLHYLDCSYCYSLKGFPEEIGSLYNLEVLLLQKDVFLRDSRKRFDIPELVSDITSLLIFQVHNVKITKWPQFIGRLARLRRLSLDGCSGLETLADSFAYMVSLRELDLSFTDVVELPETIGRLVKLELLSLESCEMMKKLPVSIGSLESLVRLDISYSGITDLPDTVWNLEKLRVIKMRGSKIEELSASIAMLEKLEELDASYSELLSEIPSTIEWITCLRILNLESTGVAQLPPKLPTALVDLRVSLPLQRVPESNLSNLHRLVLDDYRPIHRTGSVQLQPCELQGIEKLCKLVELRLKLWDLTSIPEEFSSLSKLKFLTLDCPNLQYCPPFPSSLSTLVLIGLDKRTKLPRFSNLKNLLTLEFRCCRIRDDTIENLGLGELQSLERLSLSSLEFRNLDGLHLPESLHLLEISRCLVLKSLPALSHLKNLKELTIVDARELVEIPELGSLRQLQELTIEGCYSLEKLPNLSKLQRLRGIYIHSCWKFKGIDGIYKLVSLKNLEIEGCDCEDVVINSSGETNVDSRKQQFEDLEGTPAADVVIYSAGQTHMDSRKRRFEDLGVAPALDSMVPVLHGEEDTQEAPLQKIKLISAGSELQQFSTSYGISEQVREEMYSVKDCFPTGVESGRMLRTPFEVVLSFSHKKIGSLIFEDMKDAGIRVFGGNEELHEGEKTDKKFLRAINKSEICIPIFTKHYACSARCLRELVHIVDSWRKLPRQQVIPIFYDVEPSDVKLETEMYIDALDEHRVNFPPETVREWEEALREVAQLQGWNFKAEGSKNSIKFVVNAVLNKLKERHRRVLVGMEAQVEKLKRLLQDESRDVLFIGMHGIGGIGKTTLAKAVFDQLSTHFEASSFLRDVRETSKQKGLKHLQDQLLRDIIGADIESKTKTTRHVFLEKKVLIVLDDVDETRQIEKLVGRSNRFVSGSRILVTTRDINVMVETETLHEDVLKGPKEFKMEKMEPTEALELFCSHAFGEGSPPDNYRSTCEQVVHALGRLPLALEVIGSFLNHKPENVWNVTLEKLQNLPDQELHAMLMIVYKEALDLEAKEVFLDIACFFNGVEKTSPLYMWDACELLPKQGIEVLIFMSFIKVLDDNRLWMHDEVRDFGRNIARGVAITDLDKGSRFWTNQEVLDILRSNEVNEHVQGLRLRFDEFLKDCIFPPEGLGSDLPNLRFLDFSGFPLPAKLLLPKLKWLSWHFCPQNVKETDLCLKKLVILDLSESGIDDQFCGSVRLKLAKNLKVLNLTSCKRITKTPSFSKRMILERLILEDCEKLVEIDSSIGKLKQLMYLNVKGCYSLEELPKELCSAKALTEIIMEGNNQSFKLQESTVGLTSLSVLEICNVKIVDALHIGNLERLERLTLSGCSGTKEFPEFAQFFTSLVKLDLSGSGITHLPDTIIGEMRKLKVINIESSSICKLPESVWKLEKLEELHARKCRDLCGEIPSEIGNLSSLSILDLSFTGISSLPSTLSQLSNLQTLNLESCDELKGLPALPKSLVSLHVTSEELQHLPDLSEMKDLRDVKWMEKLKLCIPRLTALKFGDESQLRSLSLSCRGIEPFPQLPSTLSRLCLAHLNGDTNFTSLCNLERLTFLELISCSMGSSELRNLGIAESKSLEHLSASKCNFSSSSGPWLPERLKVLSLKECELLDGAVLDLSGLKDLMRLELMDCQILSELRCLGELESLEEIIICNCNSVETLGDLSNLQKLEALRVLCCEVFREVEGLEEINSLEHLEIWGCKFLKSPPRVSMYYY